MRSLRLVALCIVCLCIASIAQNAASKNQASSGEDTKFWQITPNPKLKGPTGRIVVQYPGKPSMIFHVLGEENKQLVAWYAPSSGNFMPGRYTVRIWDGVMPGVPVKKNMDTRIKVGMLKLNIEETYKLLDSEGKSIFSGHAREKKFIVVPVGSYRIKTPTLEEKIEIQDGKVTEF